MKLDAHVHFWHYNPEEFAWVRNPDIQTDFLPGDFAHTARPEGYDGCISVQARFSYEENDFMLELAEHDDHIMGVVGWVNLLDDHLDDRMQALVRNPKLVGVRDFIDDCIDADGRIRWDFAKGLKTIETYGKVFEFVIRETQLPDALLLARAFPGLTFVIDHMAKPGVLDGRLEPWASNMKAIAKQDNVFCKLSGIATEADPTGWSDADFKPYLDVVFNAFGPRRLMIGSDWPVCLGAGAYGRVMGIVEDDVKGRTGECTEDILGGNALRVYGIAGHALPGRTGGKA